MFVNPVLANTEWLDIEGLLLAVGCKLVEGNRSRVRFVCKDVVAAFNRPHPGREAKRYQVRDARGFLIRIGVEP